MQPTQQQLEEGRRFGEAYVRFLVAMKASEVVPNTVPSVRTPIPEKPAASKASQPLLVTPIEAAKLLSVSPRKLWGMTAPRGPLPVVRLGRTVRYSVGDLANALEKLRSNS